MRITIDYMAGLWFYCIEGVCRDSLGYFTRGEALKAAEKHRDNYKYWLLTRGDL